MSTVPETPRSKTSFNPSTPTTSRITGSHVQSSPHYTTTRRHSLYGVEDRIIIDPGSLIWKVGFSGEGRPREVFYAGGKAAKGLWGLTRATDGAERQEEDKLLDIRLEQSLRAVFHDSLLTDPKARKVIIVENPLLPLHIKEALARILFGNLQVPSVSFASSHLLSLLAVGRITGLVLDCGNLESVALPIFAARPLFSQLRTTPLAGQRFLSHLRSLLLLFGTYVAPTSPGIANLPQASRSMRVPQEILTNEVLEEIKTRCCFVGESLAPNASEPVDNGPTPDDSVVSSDMDVPPTSDPAQSESEFSFAGRESGVSSQHDSSEYSVISTPRMGGKPQDRPPGSENRLQVLADMYMRHSTATDLQLRVEPPVSMASSSILGYGTIIIPGWIRERTAEVLFEGGDVDEGSLAEIILDALLKVPVDLRKTLASSILIVGGTSMLPGFIPRLHVELLRAISPPPPPPSRQPTKHDKAPPPHYDRYATLRPLIPYLSILNNPSPPAPLSDRAKNNGGKAPAFSPATMAWVGGSLAGALKTGGTEVSREKWDEADPEMEDTDTSMSETPARSRSTQQQTRALQIPPPRNILPDWTRLPLPVGAPSVGLSSTSVKSVSPTALIPTSRARENEEWEDLSDGQDDVSSSKERRSSSLPTTSRSSRQISPRKRRLGYQTSQTTRNTSNPARAALRNQQRPREFPTEEWIAGVSDVVRFTLRYLVDVLGGGVQLLRKPLSFLLFLWLLAFIMSRISSTLKTAFKPLCIIPGIGSSALCRTDSTNIKLPKLKGSHTSPQWADYPGLINAQSLTFEQLLDDSVGGSGLSLDIKKAEMATSDLVTLVKFSELTSKELLAESLSGFVEDARRTGRGLQRLGSKVGGAVDQIMAVNDYAVNSIAAAQASSPSKLYSIIPFYSVPSTQEIVLRTFVEAMGVLSTTIERLVVEAEVQLANLERLEERLSMIHELVSREDSTISSAKSELLSELWTKLGGNKRTLRGYDDHLKLLNGLGEYRKQALVHVVSSLQTLRALSDDMEDIRERVSEPELASSHIPVEVHMNSIRTGLQRLKHSRVKAREREEEAIKKVLGEEHFAALGG